MDIREKLLNKHESRFDDIVSNGKEAQILHLGCHSGVALVVSFGGVVLVSYHKTIILGTQVLPRSGKSIGRSRCISHRP